MERVEKRCLTVEQTVWCKWSIAPGSRYTSRQFTFNKDRVAALYDADGEEETEVGRGLRRRISRSLASIDRIKL